MGEHTEHVQSMPRPHPAGRLVIEPPTFSLSWKRLSATARREVLEIALEPEPIPASPALAAELEEIRVGFDVAVPVYTEPATGAEPCGRTGEAWILTRNFLSWVRRASQPGLP